MLPQKPELPQNLKFCQAGYWFSETFMLIQTSWLGKFDDKTFIKSYQSNWMQKENFKAVYFLLFAFDKDNAMYFPAGDQLFGDNSGLLKEKPQALRQ